MHGLGLFFPCRAGKRCDGDDARKGDQPPCAIFLSGLSADDDIGLQAWINHFVPLTSRGAAVASQLPQQQRQRHQQEQPPGIEEMKILHKILRHRFFLNHSVMALININSSSGH